MLLAGHGRQVTPTIEDRQVPGPASTSWGSTEAGSLVKWVHGHLQVAPDEEKSAETYSQETYHDADDR